MDTTIRPRKSKLNGEAYTPEYKVWQGLVARCTLPTNASWDDYGGRGITVCARWRSSYANFLQDMGRRPSAGYEIDRKNNDDGYSPSNCHWTTQRANSRNRRSNRMVTFRGQLVCLAEACELAGMPYDLVSKRLSKRHVHNWPGETALTTPAQSKAPKGMTTRPTQKPMTNCNGLTGVKQHRSGFIGRTVVDGKRMYSKQFKTAEEAHIWYIQHKQKPAARTTRSYSSTRLSRIQAVTT